jgi:cell division protease FtsH
MSEKLGPRVFGHDHGQPFLGREFSAEPDYSDEIAREIDDEIRRIVEAATSSPRTSSASARVAHHDLGAAAQARDDRARGVRGPAGRQGAAEVFGADDPAISAPSARSSRQRPTATAAPSPAAPSRLAGGAAEVRGLELPEKPELA